MRKESVVLGSVLLALAGLLAGCGGGGSGEAQPLVAVSGVSPEVAAASVIGLADPHMPMTIGLYLPIRNQAQLNQDVERGVQITPAQFIAEFAPAQADYDRVKAFAASSGLKDEYEAPNRMLLDVTGDAAQVGLAFHVHILRLRGQNGVEGYGPDGTPRVPADVAALLQGLSGMDNLAIGGPAGAAPRTTERSR